MPTIKSYDASCKALRLHHCEANFLKQPHFIPWLLVGDDSLVVRNPNLTFLKCNYEKITSVYINTKNKSTVKGLHTETCKVLIQNLVFTMHTFFWSTAPTTVSENNSLRKCVCRLTCKGGCLQFSVCLIL